MKERDIKIMNQRKYTKEDLVWEAVRRNKEYQKFYFKCLKENFGKEDITQEIIECIFTGYVGDRWILDDDSVLNPNITADNMKDRIAAGSNPSHVNPYYSLFNSGTRRKAVIEIFPPKMKAIRHDNIKNGKTTITIGWKMIRFLNKVSRLQKRGFFASIDPTKSEVEINKAIAKLRHEKLESLKFNRNNQLEPEYAHCYIPRINLAMEHLKKYDELFLELSRKVEQENIEFKNGVFQIPGNYRVEDLIPEEAYQRRAKESGKQEEMADVYDVFRTTFPTAYEKASELISKAPRIKFHSKVK
jgi:hypothetical protein